MLVTNNKVHTLFPKCNPMIPLQTQMWRDLRDENIKYYFTKYPGIIGIEVEYEGIKRPMHSEIWESKNDQSLKILGAEFISKPIMGRNIDVALYELENYINKTNKLQNILCSHRTSIHVHFNVTNIKIEQLVKIFYNYILLEEWFKIFCHPLRRENNFCMSLSDVPITPAVLFSSHPESKYLALAFNHLVDYGTIEFRMLEGTTDMVKLRRWIMMIQKLCLYSIHQPIIEISDNWEKDLIVGAQRVFNTLYGKLPTPKTSECQRNVFAANAFLNCYKDML